MACLNHSTREGCDACESLSENLAMIYLSFQLVEILRYVPIKSVKMIVYIICLFYWKVDLQE